MNDTWLEIEKDKLLDKFAELVEAKKIIILSTISGYQDGDNIYLLYHLVLSGQGSVNLRVSVPLSNPVLPSVEKLVPAAILYEREIQDILGVKFEGISDSRRLILPEHWPDGVYPLRKDFKMNKEAQKNG